MSMQDLRLVAGGNSVPQGMPELPPAREFLTSAGFGGAAALTAAVIVALIALFAARRAAKRDQVQLEQQERHHQETREDERRATAAARCWQRLVWLVETAGLEPAASENATLGLGPELALELLQGLLRDAQQLGDDTLTRSVTVYLNQFSLVLAQQAGPLSGLTSGRPPARPPKPAKVESEHAPEAAPPPELAEPAAADDPTATPSAGRRRRE